MYIYIINVYIYIYPKNSDQSESFVFGAFLLFFAGTSRVTLHLLSEAMPIYWQKKCANTCLQSCL